MTPESKSETAATDKTVTWFVHLSAALLFAAGALVLADAWRPMHLSGNTSWPDAALVLLAAASTLAALTRHLPLQNVIFAAVVIAGAGGAADWLDLKSGIPFGVFVPGGKCGPKLFQVLPWALPAIWVVALLNSRGVARLILRPWRKTSAYGFWLIGITVALTVLFSFALEPFASRVRHFWFWEPTKFPLTWQGAPLVNFFGRAVVTLLILAFVTPMLINKQPHKRLPPDYHPLGVWLGAVLLCGAACAANGLWPAAVVDGIIGVVVAIFSIRGARW